MCDIRTGIANIAIHLAHDTYMFIAIEKRIFVLTMNAGSTAAAV